ncbi:hypothetical protein [Aporhodopirellula aestuarii]|uniref:Uncharacterized protein n=1 Tax=Aporhodopirellula aestuarii TaxID=2950107 RepID=A0ABT0UD95_9BACT|nr:hypothetical protein [Aporhodopirellula aestuarii]MCM2374348.1 hypothetical protein [Aporhodopirellula aestuarii]
MTDAGAVAGDSFVRKRVFCVDALRLSNRLGMGVLTSRQSDAVADR